MGGILEAENFMYINFNEKIRFVIRANSGTSSVTERTKLVYVKVPRTIQRGCLG